MSTLYITQQDTVLRKVDERLKVTHRKETLLDIPLIKVSQVVLFGRVTVTAATVATLLEHGIGLCYLSEYGRYIGRLEPEFSKNSLLRVDQYKAAFDDQRKLAIARQCVLGKLANMRVMLLRGNREKEHPVLENAIARLKEAERAAAACQDLEALRGHEGDGSAAYFSAFGVLIKQDFSFPGRVRRPPTDPVNALLSFGYTLLYNDLQSACNVVGFDPYIGYLHADRYGRANLALDLMEEFRPIIVDSVVLTCLNKRILQSDDFVAELGGAYRLSDKGRKQFLLQYEERKQTEFKHPVFGYRITYQRCFELQARLLAKHIQGEIDAYPPLLTK
ncbi:MAG: type I-D CRISPR-associated endonuclease Cas1 [Nitrospinota bacterium]|nr:MAG: type I-D CRISPR-associated endonuclease Cas1 [Nitrospinota bacterium]